jgi:hypothetical protein
MARVALVRALVIAAVVSAASSALAQAPGEAVTVVDPIDIPPEHDPLAHAWDLPNQRGGFYLRGSTSLGGQNVRIGAASFESGAGYTTGGFGTGYSLDLGGFIRPWLALHLDTSLGVLWSGGNRDDLGIAGTIDDDGDTRVLSYGVAPAVTFFTPHRFFFKPAFGVGMATVKSPYDEWTTKPGFYMHLVAGKDLYTDQHFSFGLQLEMAYLLLNAKEEDNTQLVNVRKDQDVRVRQFLFGVSFAYDSI